MRILIACEFSGIVRDHFTARGHDAISCDLQLSERPGKHLPIDVAEAIALGPWDMMIAFPPCTHLAASGRAWFKYKEEEQRKAIDFVIGLASVDIPKIAIENPIGILSTRWRKPDQIIHPWQFGHIESKATCLWLKGLPPLHPTNIVSQRLPTMHSMPESKERAKNRSRMFSGIAKAMAEQWG